MEAFFGWLFKLLEPLIKWIGERYQRYAKKRDIRRTAPDRIGVLLTKIDRDVEDSHRRTIKETIARQLGGAVEITEWPEPLPAGDGQQYDVQRRTHGTAQRWLKEAGCDVLVAGREKGRNAAGETVLSLQFVTAERDDAKGDSYRLDETLDLPVKFIADLGAAIAARVVLSASPAIHRSGEYLVPLMRVAAERLAPLVERLNPAFDADTRGTLLHSYALVRATIGQQAGSNADLAAAIESYRTTLQERTRARVPLDWATTQNSLGIALGILGAAESDTARLEQAVEAFRAALQEGKRERVPLDWAATQTNLGNALALLGERESDTVRLEQAVEAYRAALQERTRERVPLDWAVTQNNLGNALRGLGEREGGTARLEQAIEAFRAALQERTRERVPLAWAMTQNNLGEALRILGPVFS